jgi:antitoxin YefM
VKAITLKEAQLRFQQVIEQVIADAEPTIILSEDGTQVVILPLDEYNSWQKTLSLSSSPVLADKNAR